MKLRWVVNNYKLFRKVSTPEDYASFVGMSGFMSFGVQPAGPYPQGPDNGWRYDFTRRPVHNKLLKRYGLDQIAGQGSTFERTMRVMNWLCAHTYYNGMSFWTGALPDNGLKILRHTYDKPFKRAINCRHKAIALADCLMAVGINALPVAILNLPNNHFITHVWLPEENRWVMCDPSFSSYISDPEGRALNLIEIALRFWQGEEILVAQYDFNGTQDCRETYLNAFILLSLREIEVYNGTGSKRSDPRNRLLPEGTTPPDEKLKAISATELLAEPITLKR